MSQSGTSVRQPSIAIAGGGIIGMSIAWRLAQAGLRVTVFDKGLIGGEASWAGAGMLAPGGEVRDSSPLAILTLESHRLYPEFVRELEQAAGLAIDYQNCGALDLAYRADDWEVLKSRAARQAELGIPSKPVDLAHVGTFWPRIRNEGLAGALFYPEDAIVNPRELMLALSAACTALGVEIVQSCTVVAAEVSSDSVTVETARDTGVYDALVLAAGAWSNSVRIAGVPPLPVAEPVKGHLIGYQQPEQTCNTILRHGHTYLLQRANGLLIAGASVEHVGFYRDIEPEIAAALAEQAGFLMPHLVETSPSEVWTGFRPGSASDRPQLGWWHSRRLYLAYGHYRSGILLAPGTAQTGALEITANWRKQ